jgi:hypothetical protein
MQKTLPEERAREVQRVGERLINRVLVGRRLRAQSRAIFRKNASQLNDHLEKERERERERERDGDYADAYTRVGNNAEGLPSVPRQKGLAVLAPRTLLVSI